MADYNEIVLAAWLQGIYKFAKLAEKEDFLKEDSLIKDCLPNDVQADDVIRLAKSFYKPSNPSAYDELIIAHAGRLSAGDAQCKNYEMPKKPLIRLISIQHIEEIKEPSKKAYSPLKPMEGENILEYGNETTSQKEYENLWQDFFRDFRTLNRSNYHDYMKSLDTLIERYCWCIPSTSQDDDISLYQHSKMTAAFARTLYLYHEEKKTQTEDALKDDTVEKFLFIQGDMSGIQRYIFDIRTHDNSAKTLRARSFQVWALCEILAEHLACKFNVSHENIITSSGGKFLLLAPKIDTVTDNIPKLREDIEEFFLDEFAGKITFVLSEGVLASGCDLQKGNMQKLIDKIGTWGEIAKQKKMQTALRSRGHVLEDLYERLHDYHECEYCGTLPGELMRKESGKRICPNCNDLIDKGGKLLKANIKENKIVLKTDKLTTFKDMVRITEQDDKEFGYFTEYKSGFPLMSIPYTAPSENNEICTFEQIANNARGDKKLAMFKADIDNLGFIFSSSWGEGKENRISFSRYAQLSRQLHYFFSAYVAHFISNHNDYKDTIYTVFSGGDDLCVVGSWDAVMRFARDFRKKFSDFTNNNPSVTISGGIALFNHHLPVRSAKDMAEEALKEAKKLEIKINDEIRLKNGISVFGVTVSWEKYDQSLKNAEDIIKYIKNEDVSSAVVYKMIDFANRAKNVNEGSTRERDMLWMSNFSYNIYRNIKPENEEAIRFFSDFGASPQAMERSRIAVCYALYANR